MVHDALLEKQTSDLQQLHDIVEVLHTCQASHQCRAKHSLACGSTYITYEDGHHMLSTCTLWCQEFSNVSLVRTLLQDAKPGQEQKAANRHLTSQHAAVMLWIWEPVCCLLLSPAHRRKKQKHPGWVAFEAELQRHLADEVYANSTVQPYLNLHKQFNGGTADKQLRRSVVPSQQCVCLMFVCLFLAPIKNLRTSLPGKLRLAPQAPSPGWHAS